MACEARSWLDYSQAELTPGIVVAGPRDPELVADCPEEGLGRVVVSGKLWMLGVRPGVPQSLHFPPSCLRLGPSWPQGRVWPALLGHSFLASGVCSLVSETCAVLLVGGFSFRPLLGGDGERELGLGPLVGKAATSSGSGLFRQLMDGAVALLG